MSDEDQETIEHLPSCVFRGQFLDPGKTSCDCWARITDAVVTEAHNVFEQDPLDEAQAIHQTNSNNISVLEPVVESLTPTDMKKASDAFLALSRDCMKAFLIAEEALRQAAQLCTDFSEAFSSLNNQGEDNE